jgi:hypothetical protein
VQLAQQGKHCCRLLIQRKSPFGNGARALILDHAFHQRESERLSA